MKLKWIIPSLGIVGLLQSCNADNGEMDKIVDRALAFSAEQSALMYDALQGKDGALPRTMKDGNLVTCTSEWWTSGFFPGVLWYLYENDQLAKTRKMAEEMTARMIREQHTTTNHDVGFQINCSAGNGYRLTGNAGYRVAMVNAANSLATRFDERVGCTKSWDQPRWQFPVIIDNMMNLELLCIASRLSRDDVHERMARSHADRTLKCHFRDDGSSYHLINYDSISGRVLERMTHQGYSDDSAWARGQAWGLYGYTMMYRETGVKAYLDHAVKIGKFIMNHPNMPKDKIPYWDFNAPDIPYAPRDVSAAAIMASAYLELSTMTDGVTSDDFRLLAEEQIRSMASDCYMARLGENAYFILEHSTGNLPAKSEVDVPLPYADYYFIEALIRYKRLAAGQPVAPRVCD